jgi:hypothetical protein
VPDEAPSRSLKRVYREMIPIKIERELVASSLVS